MSQNGSDLDCMDEETPPQVLFDINEHTFDEPKHKVLKRYEGCRPEPRSGSAIQGEFNLRIDYAADKA